MAKDKRQRNARHLRTGSTKTRVLEWASPAQKEAFEYGPYPILASGGFNSTKTTAFILKILFLSEMYPGNRGVIARKIGKELRETTLASLLKWLPSEAYSYGGRLATTEGVIRLNNGSEILLLHLDDPETENVIRGLEINWFLLDQAEELSEEIFDLLMMRLGRWDKAVVPDALLKSYEAKGEAWPWWSKDAVPRAIPPTYGMLTCNPDHELHWLYRRFHPDSIEHTEKKFLDPETDELQSYQDLGYKMLFFSTLENKFLTKQQKAQLLAKDEMYQRRFVRGEWGIPEGQIHAIEKASLIPGTPELVADLQLRCKLHRGMDHGDTSPTSVGWAAVDDDQNIFCVAPDTRILKSDLTWASAGSLKAGDNLVGFDEFPSETGRRRYRTSEVLATETIEQPCFRLTLDDGTSVVCSVYHQWLVKRNRDASDWRLTEDINVGTRLVRSCETWSDDGSWGGGYLAGAFDGEGHLILNQRGTLSMGLSQKDNPMLARVMKELRQREIRYGLYPNETGCYSLAITKKRDIMRLLGSVRPDRLLPKFTPEALAGFRGYTFPRVVSKEPVGIRHVVSMKTSTSTYIAEGLASHNCYREYYMPNTLISQHRRNIAGLSKMPNGEPERYGFQVADPSIFHKSQRSGAWWSVAQEYSDMRTHERHTAIHWAAGDKDELGTRNRISELLRPVGPRIHPITKEMGMWPRLFFITRTAEYPQGCDHIIREIKAQKRVRIGTENGKPIFSDERDDSIADHAYDWLRYLIAAGIAKPKALVTNTRTQQTFAEVLAERKRDQAKGLDQMLARRLRYGRGGRGGGRAA